MHITGTRMALAALLAMTVCSVSMTAIPKGNQVVELQPVVTGLVAPMTLTASPDGKLFIVEQTGQIRIMENGVLLATPFLDISAKLTPINTSYDERGLLGLAFHPNYASNGKFYVYYTAPTTTLNWSHKCVLSEFTVSASPYLANPASERVLLTFDHPQSNHNAGKIAFGPDGYLYITSGDGGNAGDRDPAGSPIVGHTPGTGNALDNTKLLGKILRIDVDHQDPGLQYSIPPTNPFAGSATARKEILALGLRNPFSVSFDRGGSNRLFAGDVGQSEVEEVDIITNGGNYGWRAKEGTNTYDATLSQTGYVDPVAEYFHSAGDGTAIIGGYVYRGANIPFLQGKYVFGDLSRPRLLYLNETSAGVFQLLELKIGLTDRTLPAANLKGFGEDANGEIYVLVSGNIGPSGTTAQIVRLAPAVVEVAIESFQFVPQVTKVLPGDTVRWTNYDLVSHTTTSGISPNPDGTWDSGFLATGSSFSFTFANAGSYPYFCKLHPSMTASVEVLTPSTILASLALSDGQQTGLQAVTVTGLTPGGFWVESQDRLSGVFVASSFPAQAGWPVDVIGTMATVNGRRQITAEVVRASTHAAQPVFPLAMNNAAFAAPPAPNGVLVKVWGTAAADQGADYFVITDGSPGTGIKVLSGTQAKPAIGSPVMVTGIRSVEGSPAGVVVITRTQADIQ